MGDMRVFIITDDQEYTEEVVQIKVVKLNK